MSNVRIVPSAQYVRVAQLVEHVHQTTRNANFVHSNFNDLPVKHEVVGSSPTPDTIAARHAQQCFKFVH